MKKIIIIFILIFVVSCIVNEKVETENDRDIIITNIEYICYYGSGRRNLVITTIIDEKTEKEYIIFDNFESLEVRER